ncbi:MAG: DUF3783 domain-containing protein [Coprobacillus sp.]
MKEIVLLYHIDEKTKTIIETIMSQLDVDVKYIEETQVNETIGYLLEIPGFEKDQKNEFTDVLEKEFIFFAGFSDEQLDLVLDIFKAAQVPYIPFKAMLTNDNVTYPFYRLYQNVEHEYEQITNGFKNEESK